MSRNSHFVVAVATPNDVYLVHWIPVVALAAHLAWLCSTMELISAAMSLAITTEKQRGTIDF